MVVASDQNVHLQSRVVKVTVLKDRAQVFRAADAKTLAPGDYSLRFIGPWSAVDRDSLQVSVTRACASQVVLRAVQFTNEVTVADVREDVAAIDAAIKVLKRNVRDAEDRVAHQTAALEMIDRVRTKALRAGALPTSATYNTQKWDDMVQFLDAKTAQHTSLKRQHERDLTQLKQQLQDENYRRLHTAGCLNVKTTREYAEALVTVTGTVDVKLEMILSYMVRNAAWKPLYDVRVSRAGRSVSLSYHATITQSTGEAWNDVELELSTAKAHVGGEPPSLNPRYLDVFRTVLEELMSRCEDLQEQAQMFCKKSESAAPMRNLMTQMMAAPPPPPAAAPRLQFSVPAPTAAASVSTTTTSASFTIAGTTTVATGNEPVRVTIAQLVFPAHFRFSAVPKIGGHVYLKVKAVNASGFTLLPGTANVFADQQFVCTSNITEAVAPNEEFWTFLGVDEDISVARQLLHVRRSETSPMFGSKRSRVEYSYKFKVRNGKATPEEVVVWDQMPIVGDKDIVLTLMTPQRDDGISPRFEVNDVQFIEWFVSLKPAEERTFAFVFSLEHSAAEALSLS